MLHTNRQKHTYSRLIEIYRKFICVCVRVSCTLHSCCCIIAISLCLYVLVLVWVFIGELLAGAICKMENFVCICECLCLFMHVVSTKTSCNPSRIFTAHTLHISTKNSPNFLQFIICKHSFYGFICVAECPFQFGRADVLLLMGLRIACVSDTFTIFMYGCCGAIVSWPTLMCTTRDYD